MLRIMTSCAILLVADLAWAQTGLTYRFRADTVAGTVWVDGQNARQELESGEGGTAAGRIEIWRDGGRQVFVLDSVHRTYYEENAFRARMGVRTVSVAPLNVAPPFRLDGVENVRVDLKGLPHTEVASGYSCQRFILTFSYVLKLGLEGAHTSMPGLVEGTEDFCLADIPNPVALPFGHRLEFKSGNSQVDAAVAARLGALKGIPVARMLTATRQIERGDPVSATSALLVSDIRETAIAPDRFEVPKDYRFREPEIVAPVRKDRHRPR